MLDWLCIVKIMIKWQPSDGLDEGFKSCPWALKARNAEYCNQCPFRDCILFIEGPMRETMTISDIIVQAYKMHEKGIKRAQIIKHLNVSDNQLHHWLNIKDTLLPVINQYGIGEADASCQKEVRC